ncbi:uncharacterized protein LOC107636421 [Arachis ipaensis]|uniref:uncharacterized protein LOC107636421 n=1 Tax=Arachis ipaensis TaxID=130454 RepID=UPI000A2B1800|nr:uncharacterized protein LOC107636421 [Arachis ipaensis]
MSLSVSRHPSSPFTASSSHRVTRFETYIFLFLNLLQGSNLVLKVAPLIVMAKSFALKIMYCAFCRSASELALGLVCGEMVVKCSKIISSSNYSFHMVNGIIQDRIKRKLI